MRRLLVAIARLPVYADRPGFRWLLSGHVIGTPIACGGSRRSRRGGVSPHVHRGRRTGRTYETPVEALAEYGARDEIVVSPARGSRGDWYRNAVAGGLIAVRLRGATYRPTWRQLSEAENVAALELYRAEHPLYARMVLWALARLHRLRGDPLSAVARAIPMLALRLEGPPGDSQQPL